MVTTHLASNQKLLPHKTVSCLREQSRQPSAYRCSGGRPFPRRSLSTPTLQASHATHSPAMPASNPYQEHRFTEKGRSAQESPYLGHRFMTGYHENVAQAKQMEGLTRHLTTPNEVGPTCWNSWDAVISTQTLPQILSNELQNGVGQLIRRFHSQCLNVWVYGWLALTCRDFDVQGRRCSRVFPNWLGSTCCLVSR